MSINNEERKKEIPSNDALVLLFRLTEEDLIERKKLIIEGNIQAKLDVILHNQGVILKKLNKIIKP